MQQSQQVAILYNSSNDNINSMQTQADAKQTKHCPRQSIQVLFQLSALKYYQLVVKQSSLEPTQASFKFKLGTVTGQIQKIRLQKAINQLLS